MCDMVSAAPKAGQAVFTGRYLVWPERSGLQAAAPAIVDGGNAAEKVCQRLHQRQ